MTARELREAEDPGTDRHPVETRPTRINSNEAVWSAEDIRKKERGPGEARTAR
jgi:hypothetical protein